MSQPLTQARRPIITHYDNCYQRIEEFEVQLKNLNLCHAGNQKLQELMGILSAAGAELGIRNFQACEMRLDECKQKLDEWRAKRHVHLKSVVQSNEASNESGGAGSSGGRTGVA